MEPIEQVLSALEAAEVRYLVVGGVAVVLHGHLRVTADLDLVIQLDADNTRRAVDALGDLGLTPRAPVDAADLADPRARASWIEQRDLTVLGFWSDRLPGLEVDLFVAEPFDFDAAWRRRARVPLDRTTVSVVAREDLIRMKRDVGRPQDLLDVEALRALDEEESE